MVKYSVGWRYVFARFPPETRQIVRFTWLVASYILIDAHLIASRGYKASET